MAKNGRRENWINNFESRCSDALSSTVNGRGMSAINLENNEIFIIFKNKISASIVCWVVTREWQQHHRVLRYRDMKLDKLNFIALLQLVVKRHIAQFTQRTMKLVYLIPLILPFVDSSSLNDYKRCQRKQNCTQTLPLTECPSGQFLDVNFSNDCCHGCRSGIGEFNV